MKDSNLRDHNFSISPELTNYETSNLNIKRLNEDSRDSLQLDNPNKSFDDKNKNFKLNTKNKLQIEKTSGDIMTKVQTEQHLMP